MHPDNVSATGDGQRHRGRRALEPLLDRQVKHGPYERLAGGAHQEWQADDPLEIQEPVQDGDAVLRPLGDADAWLGDQALSRYPGRHRTPDCAEEIGCHVRDDIVVPGF